MKARDHLESGQIEKHHKGGDAMAVTSPDGTPIEVRPIEPAELDRVVLRCWPDREVMGSPIKRPSVKEK